MHRRTSPTTHCAGALVLVAALLGDAASSQSNLLDPTRPPGTPSPETKEGSSSNRASRVSSILLSADRQLAIVGGLAISVGDFLPEGEVTSIDSAGVVVESLDGPMRLPLIQRPVKKRSVTQPRALESVLPSEGNP